MQLGYYYRPLHHSSTPLYQSGHQLDNYISTLTVFTCHHCRRRKELYLNRSTRSVSYSQEIKVRSSQEDRDTSSTRENQMPCERAESNTLTERDSRYNSPLILNGRQRESYSSVRSG